MADAADKTKEKVKKKKTGSTKEKEKKPTEDAAPVAAATPEAPAAGAPPAAEEPKPEEAPKGEVKKKSSKKAKEPAPSAEEAAPQEPLPADPAPEEPRNVSEPVPPPPLDISDEPLVQPDYVAPAAVTKKDVDLLKDLDENKLIELKEAFELFDLNQDGFIDINDLKLTFVSLGQLDVTEEHLMQMLSEAINPLDFDSFVILLGYKTIEMDPEAVLLEALSRWDYDNSGLISEERIKHDLMTWGDKFTPQEVEMALDEAPMCVKKGTTMIDYIKFCSTLSGFRKKTKMPSAEDFMG